jgi:hypothetical protein
MCSLVMMTRSDEQNSRKSGILEAARAVNVTNNATSESAKEISSSLVGSVDGWVY